MFLTLHQRGGKTRSGQPTSGTNAIERINYWRAAGENRLDVGQGGQLTGERGSRGGQ